MEHKAILNKTILLVDDNEHDVFLAQRALRKANVLGKVVVARDGEEALDYLLGKGTHAKRNIDDLPDVTLLDLKMPRVDGLEVLKRMRANLVTRYLPVVVLTASKEDSDRLASYDGGCNAYVNKPVDFEEFTEAVKNIGFFWLALNERVTSSP